MPETIRYIIQDVERRGVTDLPSVIQLRALSYTVDRLNNFTNDGEQRFLVWSGVAGSGKTVVLGHLRQVMLSIDRTWRFYGVALTGSAAEHLRDETGMSCATLAAWLSGQERIQKRRGTAPVCVVLDESSMVGSRDMARLVHVCEKQNYNLIIVGDPNQLAPLTAGKIFERLIAQAKTLDTLVTLTENHRQEDPGLRRAVELAREGDMEASLLALGIQGRIHVEKDHKKRWEWIADRWTPETLVIGATRGVCAQLNVRIRARHLEPDAYLSARPYRATYRDSEGVEREWMGPGAEHFTLAAGDKIVFLKNEYALYNVRNGYTGEILETHADWFKVRLTSGRVVSIDPRCYSFYDYGYAVTTYKSQGLTFDNVLVDADTRYRELEDVRAQYVQITRARKDIRIATNNIERLYDLAITATFALDTLGDESVTLETAEREVVRLKRIMAEEPRRRPKDAPSFAQDERSGVETMPDTATNTGSGKPGPHFKKRKVLV